MPGATDVEGEKRETDTVQSESQRVRESESQGEARQHEKN